MKMFVIAAFINSLQTKIVGCMPKKILVILSFLSYNVNGQTTFSQAKFFKKLDNLGMFYAVKNVYKEVPVDSTSPVVNCDYAITDPTGKYEIRYKVVPLSNPVNAEKRLLFFKTNVVAIAADLGGMKSFKFHDFPTDAVKNDFNGEYGGEGYMNTINPSFSKGFKNLYMVSYCKYGQAIVYVFYLFNEFDQPNFSRVVHDTYTAIRFIDSSAAKASPVQGTVFNSPEEAAAKLYKDSLNATDEQVTKILSISQKYMVKAANLRNDNTVSASDRLKMLTQMISGKNNEISQVLNKEQYAIWERWQREQLRKRMMANAIKN